MSSRVFTHIFLYALVFASASPLFEAVEKIYVLLISAIFIVGINRKSMRFSRQSIIALYAITVINLVLAPLSDIIYGKFDFNAIGFWLGMGIPFFIAACIEKNEFIRIVEKTVLYTLLPGLGVWIFCQFFPQIVTSMPQYTYGGFTHYTLFFVNFLTYGEVSGRFVGFGSEPGLTQIFYAIALYSRLKDNKGTFDWFVILLCVAIFFTKSTAGIFMLFVILFLMVPPNKLFKYILVFSPVLLFYAYGEIIYHLDNKLIGSDSFAGRYDRYDDFFNSDIFNIIFGFGNSYYTDVLAKSGIGGYDTLLQFSQRFGLISLLALILIVYSANAKKPLIAVIIVLGFLSQAIWLMPAISFFYYAGKSRDQLSNRIINLEIAAHENPTKQ